MKLQLNRPLVFFDLETTGINVGVDRIVEISMVKLFPDSHKESLTYRVNPEMPIPAGASEVHHIYDEDVKDCPTFGELAPTVLDYILDCDLAGYNSNHFDVPMLQDELLRVGVDYDLREHSRFVDAFVIFQKHTPRNLTAAYKYYCDKDLIGAHGANADTEATYEVLMAQLERHHDVPLTVNELADYTQQQQWADLAGKLGVNEQGKPTFNFGKNKGRTLEEVFGEEGGSGYYSWFMQGDFPMYTKQICKQVMDGLKEERQKSKVERQKSKVESEKSKVESVKPVTMSDLLDKFGAPKQQKKNNKPVQTSLF